MRHTTTIFATLLLALGASDLRAADNSATASAGKQVHAAQAAVEAARAEFNQIRLRARAQLAADPQWSKALAELKDAQASYDRARHKVFAELGKDASYQKLIEERSKIQNALAAEHTDQQIQKLTDLLFKDGLEINEMEQKSLSQSSDFQNAKSRLETARSKSADLDMQANNTMKSDPAYSQALQHLATAEGQLKQARQQLAQAVQSEQTQREAKIKAAEQQQNAGY